MYQNRMWEDHFMAEIAVTTAQPEDFAFVPMHSAIADMAKSMADGFARLAAAFLQAGVSFGGPPLAQYLSYDATSSTFRLGFPVLHDDIDALRKAGLEIGRTAQGQVMTMMHVGPYATMMQTYDALQREMAARGLTGTTEMWERYLSPPETPPDQTLTEVIWPVQPKA